MNKNKVNNFIPSAYDVIGKIIVTNSDKAGENTSAADENNADLLGAFRAQISSFGAAVTMGNLLSSVAFFSRKGSAKVDRPLLMLAIAKMLGCENETGGLFGYIKNNQGEEERVKDEILTCAVALKLAMNLYDLDKKRG